MVNTSAKALFISQIYSNFRYTVVNFIFFQPVKTLFFIHFAVLLSLFTQECYAQKQKKKFKQGATIQLKDSITNFSQSDIFAFPNINRVPYYYDASKVQKLQQLRNAGPSEKYYNELKTYV